MDSFVRNKIFTFILFNAEVAETAEEKMKKLITH